jgi:hypothetical protein
VIGDAVLYLSPELEQAAASVAGRLVGRNL